MPRAGLKAACPERRTCSCFDELDRVPRGAGGARPDLGEGVPAIPTQGVPPTPYTRPHMQQAAVQERLAPGPQACRTDKWLALKLRVASGVGRLTTINGFALGALDPEGIDECVLTAVHATRFPSASPATFTLRFEPNR